MCIFIYTLTHIWLHLPNSFPLIVKIFFQRRSTNGQQAHENKLSITSHQKMQIKATMGYYVTLSGWLESKRQNKQTNKCRLGCVEHASYMASGNENWCSYDGKQCGVSLKIKNRSTVWSSNSTSGCLLEENKNISLRRHYVFQSSL